MKYLIPYRPGLAVLFHIFFAVIVYVLLHYGKGVLQLPDNNNLTNWDAHWYESIKNEGYQFIPDSICNMAFFPLFPFLWEVSRLSAFNISIVNLVIFAASLLWLIRQENMGYIFSLFIVSTASFIFFALPYSESLFFLSGTLLLSGYHQNSRPLKIFGFFFASLTRSVSLIFIPGIILTLLISLKRKNAHDKRKGFADAFHSCFSSILGFLAAAFIQYRQTGKLFYFLGIQKFWKRHWVLPQVPFTTYDPQRVLGIDGVAFLIGVIAIWQSSKWIMMALQKTEGDQTFSKTIPDSKVVFSALIIAGTTVLDVFFTFNDNGSTSIWSINRHILCTPFLVIFLHWLNQKFVPGKQEVIVLIMLLITGGYVTGVYQYWLMLLFYLLFIAFFMTVKYYYEINCIFSLFYIYFFVFQILFYNDFLLGKWIG